MTRVFYLLCICFAACISAAEIPCEWERLNLDGGGFIGRIVIAPDHSNRVYCLSDKGGVHRSDDGGETWKMCNRGFRRETCYGVSDLIIDPANPQRLYAAVGNGSWSWQHWYPGAVFRSDDGGESWTQLIRLGFGGEGTHGKGYGNRLCFAPGNSDTIYAATYSQGLYRTRNAGKDWERVGLADKFLTGIMADPDHPEVIIASAQTLPVDSKRTGGVFESRDGGKNWRLCFEENVNGIGRAAFNTDWLIAACGKEGIRFSRDRGATWQVLPHPEGTTVRVAKFQPGHPSRLWASCAGEGAKLFYTDDFGKNWVRPIPDFRKGLSYPDDWFMTARKWKPFTSINSPYDIVFDPKNPERVFVGDFFTVWRSDDGGSHFKACPSGINTLCVYQITVDPSNSDTIYVNNADLGLLKSVDGGKSFRWPFAGHRETGDQLINETGQLVMSADNPNHLAITRTIDWRKPMLAGVHFSTDGGKSWEDRSNGLPREDVYLTGLVALSRDTRELLVACSGNAKGAGNVYHTRDGGRNWKAYGKGLPETKLFGHNWQTLPNLATDGRNVYAATTDGVFHCTRSEQVWRKIGEAEFKGRQLRAIAALPAAPDFLWVCTNAGLFISSDGGKNFCKASLDAMQMCQGIVVDPADPQRWFVAVSAPWWVGHTNEPGIYRTEDGGKTYGRLSDMPGEGMAWRLALDPRNRNLLYVGTNGIGAWRTHVGGK